MNKSALLKSATLLGFVALILGFIAFKTGNLDFSSESENVVAPKLPPDSLQLIKSADTPVVEVTDTSTPTRPKVQTKKPEQVSVDSFQYKRNMLSTSKSTIMFDQSKLIFRIDSLILPDSSTIKY